MFILYPDPTMPQKLHPLLLPTMITPQSQGQSQDQNRRSSTVSVDLSPTRAHFLTLPSPYHETFSSDHDEASPAPRNLSNSVSPFTIFFKRLRSGYSEIEGSEDVENGEEEKGK